MYVVSVTQYWRSSWVKELLVGAVHVITSVDELYVIQLGKPLPSDWVSLGEDTGVLTDQELLIV